jgi:hypothetical protein
MINTTFRSAMSILGVAALGFLASCDTYSYKTPQPNKDTKLANPHVYGEVDGPALQSKKTYPTNPEAAQKAAEVKAKLFADNNATMPETEAPKAAPAATAVADTAKVAAAPAAK